MADISRIWICKSWRWNSDKKESEDYYQCELTIKGKEGLTFEVEVDEEATKKMSKIVLPLIKKALKANVDDLPDSL